MAFLTMMNITSHHPSLHLKQNMLYLPLPLSTSPVIPLREAGCVSEDAQARTT
jgi:hypothetical protein